MGTLVNLFCIAVASFTVLAQPAVSQGVQELAFPLTLPGHVLQGVDSQTCHSEEQERVRNELDSATLRLLQDSVIPLMQQNFTCSGSTGWRRIAYLNMSNPFQQCPSVWQEITTPHRVCGKKSNSPVGGCVGVNYTTGGEPYDQVCGRIIGYQVGAPYCFYGPGGSIDGDPVYVDGVSLTHGFPRQHIWTFAAGQSDRLLGNGYACPCVTGSRTGERIPSFVGMNYFCESGLNQSTFNVDHIIWTAKYLWPNGDPLWDGQGCSSTSSCCTFNSPPWFNIQLPNATIDDVEVRLCGLYFDTPIQLMELYVK